MSGIHLATASFKNPAAGGAFTPNDVATIWSFYEADSYAQSDNTSVSTNWDDKGPSNRDLTINGSNWTYQTAELNGQDVLRTTGTSYFAVPDMSSLTAGEYFYVHKMNSITTSGGHRIGNSGGDVSHYPFSGDNIYDSFGSIDRKNSIVTNATLTNWHCTYGWSATNDWAMFQNTSGTAIHTDTSHTVGFIAAPTLFYNGTQYMQCDAAALYFFSAKLSTDDRNSMKSYITGKYGLSFS